MDEKERLLREALGLFEEPDAFRMEPAIYMTSEQRLRRQAQEIEDKKRWFQEVRNALGLNGGGLLA